MLPTHHLRRLCRFSRLLTEFGMAGFVAGLVWLALSPNVLLRQAEMQLGLQGAAPAPWVPVALAALMVVAAMPVLAALWNVRRLFANFAAGEVFSDATAKAIRRIGLALLAGAALAILLRAGASLVLTWHNPPGTRALAVSIAWHDVMFALIGAVHLVTGLAMSEAARIDAEYRQFV